jgi:uncharacterized 2Fe-2S/4Fe-4S cluster protein (DUF4445 family)
MSQQLRITLQPSGKRVFVLPGTTILEAAARAGIMIDTPCGGAGTCGKCRVQVTEGAPEPDASERKLFSPDQLDQGWRLACQSRLRTEAAVSIPESSLFARDHQIVTAALETPTGEVKPAVTKAYIELDEPSLSDDAADLLRLERNIGRLRVDLDVLRQVPDVLRKEDFRCTAVVSDHRLLAIEAGDTTGRCYGVAVDLGTTTIVASLLDLTEGREMGTESMINPQVRFGDDVVSRIQHASESDRGRIEQREAVTQAINELISQLCRTAQISPADVYEIALSGNTTMEHLLGGLDVTQLGQVPFVPAFARGLRLAADDLGIGIHPRAAAYVFPVIGGFVGGDTVACMLATEMASPAGSTLLVDVGTNGEIVLSCDGKLLAASTAAGPAFEGARISCGMRAACGAIEKVILDEGDLRMGAIGGCEPSGICGSGLIDMMACLLEGGLVTCEGRIRRGDELAEAPEALARRVVDGPDDQGAIELFRREDQEPLLITQRDIREVQLGAGAIRAGVSILLKQASLAPEDLDRVLIAGGFGSFIRRSNAQRIGLLPAAIEHQKIHYVGNASLRGARWALLSTAARRRAEDLARRTRHVELSQDMEFQMEFAEAMIVPEV